MCAHVTHGEMDPELLQARLRALKDPTIQHWAQSIVDGAFSSLAKQQVIDFSALETMAGEHSPMALWEGINDAVAAIWQAVEDLRQLMYPLVTAFEAHSSATAASVDAELNFSGEVNTVSGIGSPDMPSSAEPVQISAESKSAAVLSGLLLRLAETAWAMSFVFSGEIQTFRKRLNGLLNHTDTWDLLGEVQDHVGRLKAGLIALLNGIFASLPSAGGQLGERDQSFELMSARELRTRVFELRDEVLCVDGELRQKPPGEWRELLVRVHAGVERFVFGPGFAWMRAADKSTFLKQRQMLSEIMEFYSALRAEPAKRAVDALARFLEALEVLNQRECLMVHDKKSLGLVVESMSRALASEGQWSREAIASGLAALAEAQGRDRLLDSLLAKTMAPGSSVPVESILHRAQEVLNQMGG